MAVHQLWMFPRGEKDLPSRQISDDPADRGIATPGLEQLSKQEASHLREILWLYHTHSPLLPAQCCSMVVQRVLAPPAVVWSVVRRFDNPQAYKHFISSCSMEGDGRVGSTRVVRVVSGLPASNSTERLEILDEEKHVMSFKILGGQHRLQNYHSITTLHDLDMDGKPATMVIESYVVDIPQGNTREETRLFADTIVKSNLSSLAHTSEHLSRSNSTRDVSRSPFSEHSRLGGVLLPETAR